MNTLEELKEYIKEEYGVYPVVFDGKILTYRAISFEKNEATYIYVNKQKLSDMWTVKRSGHSIDFYRTLALKEAVSPGGSLLYYFMPENKI